MNDSQIWHQPPTDLNLANNEVHIWRANLDLAAEKVNQLATIISPDEQQRAERFHFQQHRNRFIVGRGMLRQILGNYLNIEPNKLEFAYSDRGKPYLPQNNLQFNLSHSQTLAVYGFVREKKIGIDLEYIRSMTDAEKIADRFFSAKEYSAISKLSKEAKQEAFFQYWTAKEAYLKATGEGLGGGLGEIEFELTPGVKLVGIRGDRAAAAGWFVRNFIPEQEYTATVAVEGKNWNIRYYQ